VKSQKIAEFDFCLHDDNADAGHVYIHIDAMMAV
jgi:hypothetical protein